MPRTLIYTIALILSLSALSLSAANRANAEQGSLSEGSLAISPFLIEDSISPGQIHQHSIDIFNQGDKDLLIDVSISDFEPAGPHGSVRFFSSSETTHSRYSLSAWINIQTQPNFTIPPKGKTTLTFTITPPVDAEPGSHYGGLLFSEHLPDVQTNTQISKKLGALILANFGKGRQDAQLESLQTNQTRYDHAPITFSTTVRNTGNIHLAPKGKIEIQNIFGHTVGLAYINRDAQILLPETSRSFASTFADTWLLGKYTAKATVWYGDPKLELHSAITFWVFPKQQAAVALAICIISLILIYVGIRRYNRWIIRRSMR